MLESQGRTLTSYASTERTTVMKVTWNDVGRREEAGDYPFRGGILRISANDIDIWKEHPTAIFTVTVFEPLSGPKKYLLGPYELPGDEAL
jgi:hypothetical protein